MKKIKSNIIKFNLMHFILMNCEYKMAEDAHYNN